MSNLVRVPFHGDELDAVRDERGAWVSIRRVCEVLGVSHEPQFAKLKRKAWATMTMIVTVAEDGKNREIACVHLDSLPMWLATIEPSKVKPAVRDKLADYQRECAKVLRDYFFGAQGPTSLDAQMVALVQSVTGLTQTVAVLVERVADIDAVVRTAHDDAHTLASCSVGVAGGRTIRRMLREYGRLMADGAGEVSSWRSRGEMELRGFLGFVGGGTAWEALSTEQYARAHRKLTDMVRMAERIAQRRQLDLPPAA